VLRVNKNTHQLWNYIPIIIGHHCFVHTNASRVQTNSKPLFQDFFSLDSFLPVSRTWLLLNWAALVTSHLVWRKDTIIDKEFVPVLIQDRQTWTPFISKTVVWYEFTDVSEVLDTSIFRAMRFWNVGKLLPDYTAQQPKRQPSSYFPPWEPEISRP
jgi:hypothetical protein